MIIGAMLLAPLIQPIVSLSMGVLRQDMALQVNGTKSNEKIAGSLAGVAIAVALVPPIAVAGIGLGWGDWHMFGLAFLLFITNLVGIVLAAALTFVILGFSPTKRACQPYIQCGRGDPL